MIGPSTILIRVNQEDFITVNHEMGHIQYFLQYKKLPYLYRSGDYRYCHASIILSMYKGGIIGDRTSQKKFLSSIAENINVIGAIPVDKRCFYVILVLAANSGFHTPDDIIIITTITIASIIIAVIIIITIIITQVPTLASMRE